jgi:phosphatidate cytidylyltransferase
LAIRKFPAKLLSYSYPLAVKLLVGGFVLVTGWILLVWLRVNFGNLQVLYLILVIWLADIVAYFTGKRWGVTKLAPEISPGKTAEGLYGALFAAGIFALGIGFYKQMETVLIADFVLITLLTVLVSVIGDLFESLAKRVRGVKDSGTILPGHGGLYDRLDSIIAGVSVFYLGSYVREIFL